MPYGTGTKDIIRAKQREVESGLRLIVTPRHTAWVMKPESQRRYTDDAIRFVADALAGKYARPRTNRFSASSLGMCKRRQLFGFVGAPDVGEDPDAQDLMGLGTWGHLRWQAEGISDGWLRAPEVFVYNPVTRVGGSIDGLLWDDSIFELKTVSTGRFSKVADLDEPFPDHLLQFDAYAEERGVDVGSVLYETRDFGRYLEYRVTRRDDVAKKKVQLLEELNNHVADGTLPDFGAASGPGTQNCATGRGEVYKSCPFRDHCPLVKGLRDRLPEIATRR